LSLAIDGRNFSSLHFAGIMGSGMSAIAQYLAWSGHAVMTSGRAGGLKNREPLKAD